MTANYSLFIGICLLNPTLTNVGMGLQKLAVNKLPEAENARRKSLYALVWTTGLLFQGMVVVLAAKALSIGNASTLGGFAGFGLIALAVFSHLVLREKISPREMLGMATIMIGTAMLGFFSRGSQRSAVDFEQARMTMFLIVFSAVAAAAVLFMLRDTKACGGAVLGIISGGAGGLGMVFMKIVVGRVAHGAGAEAIAAAVLRDPYAWLAVVGGLGSVILVQVGYKFGKAIQVVPGFSSMIVIMPALAGCLVLGETATPSAMMSLAVITAGVLVTTLSAPGGRQ